ncbi:DEAD/DEAH box helicase [Brucella sp. NBRC 13694]|uniref:DEAD/DEAH box helicase n=1 Tax=Brucella sp. NBRC 13694 TaxID=3075482 RepID=UPI003342A9DC
MFSRRKQVQPYSKEQIMNFNDTFYYVSACAGSGKTTTAMQAIGKGIRLGEKFIVAQPTKQLIENTVGNQRNRISLGNVNIAVITSDRFPNQTHSEFIKAVQDTSIDVIFTTHSTVMSCWKIAGKSNWNLIIDEVPNVDVPFHANLSLTWDDWMKHVRVEDADDSDSLLVYPNVGSEDTVQKWAWNELDDDVIAVTQSFWEMLVNPNYRLSITKADWQTAGYEGAAKLHAHGTLLPSILQGWNRVSIMGANFEHSLLNIVWSNMGVDFQPDNAITVKNPKHTNKAGTRARIHYFTERNWSKYLRNQIGFHVIAEKLAEYIDGPHIWSANNDIEEYQWKAPKGTKLKPISHGLNSYINFDKAVYLAALNDTPAHAKWLQNNYGLALEEIGRAKAFEAAYQMVMRTNLRLEDGDKDVDIYVADRRTADYLCSLLPGSKQNFLDLKLKELGNSKRDLSRLQPAKSSSERKAESVAKRKKFKEEVSNISSLLMEMQNVMLTSEIGPMMSFEKSIHSTDIVTESFTSFDQIKDILEQMYALEYKSKDENLLITGATFSKSAESETQKGLDAFVMTQVLQLDFDDSELDPALACRLFSDIKHLAYNSYNNGRDGLFRYRMFFPLTQPVTIEVYQLLWDTLAERVIDAGYQVNKKRKGKQSGLDLSKRTPVAWMYAPCQAASKKNSFWQPNWEAEMMDPIKFIERAPAEEPEYVEAAPIDNRSQSVKDLLAQIHANKGNKSDALALQAEQRKRETAYERALDEWKVTPAGEGNAGFFKFGARLKSAGFDIAEIQQKLDQHYADSASDAKARKTQIKSIISSLKRAK